MARPNHVVEVFNAAVLTTAVGAADVQCAAYSQLTVVYQLLATVTTTDLANAGVIPYRADGTTSMLVGLPVARTKAAASDGTNVVETDQYDVRGFSKVKVQAKNNNAATKTLIITAYLGN